MVQLGTKGFGDPVTFDNTYYQTLLKKPWKNPLVYMSSMIGYSRSDMSRQINAIHHTLPLSVEPNQNMLVLTDGVISASSEA